MQKALATQDPSRTKQDVSSAPPTLLRWAAKQLPFRSPSRPSIPSRESARSRIAEDTGGGINGNHIDVYQPETKTSKEVQSMTYGTDLKVCKKN